VPLFTGGKIAPEISDKGEFLKPTKKRDPYCAILVAICIIFMIVVAIVGSIGYF